MSRQKTASNNSYKYNGQTYSKNPIIELLRFLFASIILLFHAGADAGILNQRYSIWGVEVSFFKYGYLGVEFFFVVSGFLMAKTAHKASEMDKNSNNIGWETARFLQHKVKAIMPVYCIACVLVSSYFLYCGKELIFLCERLPSIILLQRTGVVEKEYIGLAWYLSSMIIGMAIIYPVLRKHYDIYTMCIGPVIGVLIIGYFIHETGYLGGVSDWLGITYKCNYRAVAELSLGTTCYELSRRALEKQDRKWLSKLVWSAISISALVIVIINICGTDRIYNDGIILLLICVIVVVTFSKIGLLSAKDPSQIHGYRLLCYLGELSMPLFLFQNVFHYWIPELYSGESIAVRINLIYICTIILSVITVKLFNMMKVRGRK